MMENFEEKIYYYIWRAKDSRYKTFQETEPTNITTYTTIKPPQFNAAYEFPYWNGTSWELREIED